MIKKNLSAILIITGIVFIYLFLQSDVLQKFPEFRIKASKLQLSYLILGVIFFLAGIIIQIKIKKKVEKKQLLDSLPGDNQAFNLPMISMPNHYICNPARVAKLVDALSSGGSIRKVVLVRIQSRAQIKKTIYWIVLFISGRDQIIISYFFIKKGMLAVATLLLPSIT